MLEAMAKGTGCLANAAEVFGTLADECRDPETRTRLTRHAVAEASSAVLRTLTLHQSTEALLTQLLRCIGNLCADNNTARTQLLECGGVAGISRVLSASGSESLVRAAFGAALNVCLDHGECTAAMLGSGALHTYLQGLMEAPRSVWPVLCAGLDNLCEHEDALPLFEANSEYMALVLSAMQALMRDEDSDLVRGVLRTLVWILCEVVEKSAGVRRQLGNAHDVLGMFDILEYYLRRVEEKENHYADAVTNAIVAVSGEDDALTELFGSEPLMRRLALILSSGESDGLLTAAALCVGNLARTDSHCTQLLADHPAMIRGLITDRLIPRSVNVRLRHAASGLLKNLCLAQANRQPLAEWGLVSAASSHITSAVVPVQANCIGILRHLASSPSTMPELVQSAFPGVLDVARTSDVDAVRCEAARLVAAVAKHVVLECSEARDLINEFDLVAPLVRLVTGDGAKHLLLRQEGLVALTVLATQPRHRQEMLRLLEGESELAGVLADLLTSGSSASVPQAALQAASLVTQLSSSQDSEMEGATVLRSKLLPLLN
ncbi:hypothetical protein GGI20_004912 [Coemansia sp. BCRC 34301]|nr:hypothetical protein GGI20_004912 [Coemansia sp. BCRC 34301]